MGLAHGDGDTSCLERRLFPGTFEDELDVVISTRGGAESKYLHAGVSRFFGSGLFFDGAPFSGKA